MPHQRSIKQIEALCARDNLFSNVKHISRHIAFVFQGADMVCCATNGDGRSGDAHAEQIALEMLRSHPLTHHRSLSLYVTKVGGLHSCSRPCARCSRLLARYPQLRVYYTEHDGSWVEDTRLDSTHQSLSEVKRLRKRRASGATSNTQIEQQLP